MNAFAYTEMSQAELDEHSSQLAFARAKQSGDRYMRAEIELWNLVQAMFNRSQPIDHFVRGVDGSQGFGAARFLLCSQTLETLVVRAAGYGGKKPDRTLRNGMRQLMLNCLRDWVKGSGTPLSPKTLLQNIDKLEHAVDHEYPGYIDAGMLGLALTPLPETTSP
jgi:hypothetical protein